MASTAKSWTIGTLAAAFLTMVAVVSGGEKVADVADPYIFTEAEASEVHMQMASEDDAVQQTQAGFNAYTLRQILLQEVSILKLQIEAEDDVDKKAELQMRLKVKQEFILDLETEERKQMMRKES